ncbi:MAG TPA: DNA polymerase ligase N-terminal domain-containing protein [Acidimicrobiales bacterium]|nr:DNA polymerase ligase N-terminal domain-containing protein [Acidimicrobiales bacterium]
MAEERDDAAERLDRYRSMRDFGRTPEPSGAEAAAVAEPAGGTEAGGRFVVQEHHATALHWDLRLERDGTLASWAVPKGIPPDPRTDHLAVHTEDHPLMYLEFEGQIPEGEYGAGKMTVWDRGTYDCEKWSDREVMFTLHGERARGRHVLFRTGEKQWMLHRMDPPADPTREPMPDSVPPIALPEGSLPDDQEAWSFEPAWGGTRVTVASEGGRIRVLEEKGAELSDQFPELRALGRALGTVAVVLEGEVMVAGAGGRPDPEALGHRARAKSEAALRRIADRSPASFLAADVLWLEGHSTTPLPYRQRRALLERLELEGPSWRPAPSHPGDGTALLDAARLQGLPGIVARHLAAGYDPDHLRFIPA